MPEFVVTTKPEPVPAAKSAESAIKENPKSEIPNPKSVELFCPTQKIAAKYAGVSVRTIRRWIEDGMFVTEDGQYLKPLLDDFKKNRGALSPEKQRDQTATADYKEIKAKLMQLELDMKLGKLVEMDIVNEGRLARIQAVKRTLLAIPRKLAPELVGQTAKRIQELIRKEIVHAISVFAAET